MTNQPPVSYDQFGNPITQVNPSLSEIYPNVITEVLNVDPEVIEQIKKDILGGRRKVWEEKVDGKTIYYEEWVYDKKNPIINEEGFKRLTLFIGGVLTKIVPRGTLDDMRINRICKELDKALTFALGFNRRKWALAKHDRDLLKIQIMAAVEISLSRAKDGNTIGQLTRSVQIMEHINKDESKRGLLDRFQRRI